MDSRNLPKGLVPKVDHIAKTEPDKIYASMPIDDADLSRGFRDISYSQFADAINRAAWWLDETLGEAKKDDFETFAYFGPRDLRWQALMLAGIKTGRKMLCLSSRIQSKGLNSLAETTSCKTFLYDAFPAEDTPAGELKALQSDAKHVVVPKLSSWYPSGENEGASRPYNYTKEWSDAMNDHVCVFHTSGSTNLPKPIYWSNRKVEYYDTIRNIGETSPDAAGELTPGKRMFSCFMPQHIGGMATGLFYPVYLEDVFVQGPSEYSLETESLKDILSHGRVSKLWAQPTILQQLVDMPEVLKVVRGLSMVLTGAAAVPMREIEIIRNDGGPEVLNHYGSTEIMPLIHQKVPWEAFPYLSYHEASCLEFEPQVDDLCEMVIKRKSGQTTPPVFSSFPDLDEFRTGDLFGAHPTIPNTWEHRGRIDDKLSLETGQAICVAPMEQTISQSPAVESCFIGQDGRPSLVLLVEPKDDEDVPKDKDKFIEKIWSYIEEANTLGRDSACIAKNMIYVVGDGKSLPLTAKGDPARKNIDKDFHDEIEKLYQQAAPAN